MNAFNHSEMHALRLNHGGMHNMVSSEQLGTMIARRFGTCYQPIVDAQSTEMLGYEAHTRYWSRSGDTLDMATLHSGLRHNPLLLLHLELGLKKLQIAAFPGEGWLMLDMDVDSFFAGGEGDDNPFLPMFKEYAWSDREIVVNLVSHGDKQDPWRAQHAMDLLQQSGMTVALEDPGVYWGMFSLGTFLDAAMVKVSSRILQELDEKAAQAMVDWLVGAARKLGVQTVMTGVETCATLDWARKMGMDCVQGPLFARQNLQVS